MNMYDIPQLPGCRTIAQSDRVCRRERRGTSGRAGERRRARGKHLFPVIPQSASQTAAQAKCRPSLSSAHQRSSFVRLCVPDGRFVSSGPHGRRNLNGRPPRHSGCRLRRVCPPSPDHDGPSAPARQFLGLRARAWPTAHDSRGGGGSSMRHRQRSADRCGRDCRATLCPYHLADDGPSSSQALEPPRNPG